MIQTTICYLEKDGLVLLLHRVKKKEDMNAGKWIGVGGHVEEGETPEDCILREFWEETGLTLTQFEKRGIVRFTFDRWPEEEMHLYTATDYAGELHACDEGELKWVSREFLNELPKWEGDQIFLDLLWQDAPFFLLKLRYEGDKLIEAVLNGKKIR